MSERMPLLPVVEALHALEAVEHGTLLEAALADCSPFVRAELARLLPGLGEASDASFSSDNVAGPGEGWRRQRLFDAIRRLLVQTGAQRRVAAVIEDVHWADPTSLDLLDYLMAPSGVTDVPLVVTCRSEQALSAELTDWLERAQRHPRITRLDLTALSLAETREQIELLLGEAPTSVLVDRTYARSEGNAFFTEQLVSATRHGASAGELPAGLTALLLARTAPLGGAPRDVVAALAVAGRGLDEIALAKICGHDVAETRAALRELAAARLLRRPDHAGRHQLRHALLAEAVASELLPSERQRVHGAVGDILAQRSDHTLAAEIAEHLRAAGRFDDELRWRVAAARRAETLFAWHDAADQWLRALELWKRAPSDLTIDGMSLLGAYGAAQDALDAGGQETASGELAQEALALYGSNDRASRAEALTRAGWSLARSGDEHGVGLLREAIALHERLPPSRGFVRALEYLYIALWSGGHPRQVGGILRRAADIASQAGERAERLRILSRLACTDIDDASVEQIVRLRAQLTATDVPELHAYVASRHAFILFDLGRHAEIRRIGLPAIERAGNHGVAESREGCTLYQNVAESLLELGQDHEAAAFIDPITDQGIGSVRQSNLVIHAIRAQLDMLRGAAVAATERWAEIRAVPPPSLDFDVNMVPWEVEFHLWQGDYETAFDRARSMLQQLADAEGGIVVNQFLLFACALLVLGLRAVADLAERGRAQHSERTIAFTRQAAADLEALRQRIRPRPFDVDDHRPEAPAEMWQSRAELSRAKNNSDATLWGRAADAWEGLNRPHRAAYARWRQAEALLAASDGRSLAAPILRRAAEQAVQHVPLAAAIADLARRARIDLTPRPTATTSAATVAESRPGTFSLTDRELTVLRLLADGKTNAEIGAALFMSGKTASVHVTHILRKFGVTTRVQAAAVAERAGLLTPAEDSYAPRIQPQSVSDK
jgi:DNA-binding CsgD family transcriptional regulator